MKEEHGKCLKALVTRLSFLQRSLRSEQLGRKIDQKHTQILRYKYLVTSQTWWIKLYQSMLSTAPEQILRSITLRDQQFDFHPSLFLTASICIFLRKECVCASATSAIIDIIGIDLYHSTSRLPLTSTPTTELRVSGGNILSSRPTIKTSAPPQFFSSVNMNKP